MCLVWSFGVRMGVLVRLGLIFSRSVLNLLAKIGDEGPSAFFLNVLSLSLYLSMCVSLSSPGEPAVLFPAMYVGGAAEIASMWLFIDNRLTLK